MVTLSSESGTGESTAIALSGQAMVDLIETVIDSLDSDDTAMVSHGDGGYIWKFKYGSVEVFVQLTGVSEEDTLTVWAVVLPLPTENEAAVMRHLLTLNWAETLEARFALLNADVVVVAKRSLAELSPGEISRAVTIVATLADDHDDALKAQFGV
jgi:hypothetical protein